MTTGQSPQTKAFNPEQERLRRDAKRTLQDEQREARERDAAEATRWRALAGSPTMKVPKSRKRSR